MNLVKIVDLLTKIVANGLVAALDFCMGACISVLMHACFGQQSSFVSTVAGGLLGLLPDIDLWSMLFKKKSASPIIDHHETAFHLPIPMTLLVSSVIGLTMGTPNWMWLTITALCLIGHYIHDMTGPFGGLPVLWPFCTDYFGTNGREEPSISKRMNYIRNFGHNAWLETYWMRFSKLSVYELCVATAFAIATFSIDRHSGWIIYLCLAAWVSLYVCHYLQIVPISRK